MRSSAVADIYGLSPLQEGMLFHTLYSPGSGAYCDQQLFALDGDLDVPLFERAWQLVARRHDALRSTFHWQEADRPLQVVHREVEIPCAVVDWRGIAPAAREREMERFLAADRARGFDLTAPPLMRLTLFRLADRASRFVWTCHHLLIDAWSGSLLMRELRATFAALRAGRPPALPAVRPYRDYIAWLQRQPQAGMEDYWRRLLRGFTAPTALAIDQAPGRRDEEDASGTESLALAASETAALTAWVRARQLTLNTLLQGAWALLLAHYSGQDDVLFGCTVAGRPAELPGVEDMVGLFINTLPLRVRVDRREPALPWLRRLQAEQVEQRRYEHSPLVRVQTWSEVPRGTRLFETLLVVENLPADILGSGAPAGPGGRGLAVHDLAYINRTGYPLTAVVVPGRELELRLVHQLSRFAAPAVRRLLGQLRNLLLGLAADGEEPLWRVPLLDAAERRQVLEDWNRTAQDFAGRPWVPAAIAARAERAPDAVALVAGGSALSYGELARRSRRVARCLRGLGVGPEAVVGVCIERSLELVVALLGVLSAGAAYLPLDPRLPAERRRFLLADAGARRVLTAGAALPELAGSAAEPIALDSPRVTGQPAEPVALEADGESPAYLLYTSGSTGRPKGVLNTHRGLRNRLAWMQQAYNLSATDRVLQKTPLAFDVSVWELFWPLEEGAALVLARPEGHRDPGYLAATVAAEAVTVMHFVPSLLEPFLAAPELAGCRSLRLVVASGEALPAALVERFHRRTAEAGIGAALENLYGPTEAAIDVTRWSAAEPAGRVPIGRSVANTRMYVLDRDLQPVAWGAVGELYIGGAQLARGYQGRPDLTAERFLPDPWSGEAGERLYRTGDLGSWNASGQLEFHGRTDDQVKLRGYRIEPGEVEAALCGLPSVREAAVQVRGGRLVAWVVAAAPVRELRSALEERLPDFLVPSLLVPLAALPRTASGKLDRRALPDPQSAGAAPDEGLAAPRSAVERQIAAVWQEVLERDRVGLHDNFFEVGGHSLLAVRAAARLQETLGRTVQVMDLFHHPTVAALAAHLAGDGPAEGAEPAGVLRDRVQAGRERLAERRGRHPAPPEGGDG